MKNLIVTGAVILLLGLLSMPASAQVFFVAQLDGSQEGSSIVTSASGTAFAELSPDTKTLTFRVTYANLDSTFTAAHFHDGAPGVSGPVVEPISSFHGNTADSSWNIPDSLIADLMKGNIYINVHSDKYKGGEIRGQLKQAGGIGFSMSLDGAQEGLQVPGTGTGWAVLLNDTSGLMYHITVAGLTSTLTGSHFHYGAAGQNGPVIHPITITDSTSSGVWYFPDSLSLALAFDSLYVNVHTSNHTGGEIRGQFQLQPRTLANGSSIFFKASLSGDQSVPPDTTQATATAWAVLHMNNGASASPVSGPELTYRVTYANLSSPFKAAHFHMGQEGTNGGVVMPINFVGNTSQGTWTGIPDSVIAAMLKGGIYLNIHSNKYPNGEIRGQLKMANGVPFSISLDGSQDVPAISTGATGTGWAELDTTGTNLNYHITVAGLSSNLTAAHFHNGGSGTNGGVVDPISFTDSTSTGIWSAIPDSLLPDLLNGSIYANVHTSNHPGGEIRGQLIENNGLLLTAVKEVANTVPQRFELQQNYPNPFNPSTIISYNLPEKAFVSLDVFNILGEKVATLVSESQQGGAHFVKFDGEKFASGVYFYRLTANGQSVQVRKMILLK
jgi:Cu/Zn superoxide dismutase